MRLGKAKHVLLWRGVGQTEDGFMKRERDEAATDELWTVPACDGGCQGPWPSV